MKLFVLGVIGAVLVPLSSFAWDSNEVESIAVVADPVPTPIRETSTPTPTPTLEAVVEEPVVEQAPLPPVETVEYTEPEIESQGQRVTRLAQSQGITALVRVGECHIQGLDSSTIMGCYYPGTHYITITPNAIQYDDGFVTCIINHEWRHMWQDLNGMYQYTNGYLSNAPQLEADAYAYSSCS